MSKSALIPIWESNTLTFHHFGMKETDYPPLAESFAHFHINKIEDYRDKMRFPFPPHRKEVYDLLFLTKGSTRRSKALSPFEFGKNTFFFLPAYQITNHDFMSGDAEGYYCHFSLDIFNEYLPIHNTLRDFPFLQFTSYPLIEIDAQMIPFIVNIFQRLEFEYWAKNTPDLAVVTAYLFTLFNEVNRFYQNPSFTKSIPAALLTEKYKEVLAKYIYEKQKVAEYAELLNVSPNHLNKCVKQTTGKSAQDVLFEMILLEAKVLLKQSDMPIGQIAYLLTKQDHSSFSRFFKTHTGVTPKEYALTQL